MSKKRSRTAESQLRCNGAREVEALVILLSILAGFVVSIVSTSAQGNDTSAAAARNQAFTAATAEVLAETSQLRELAILHPVQSSAQSRAEIEKMVVANLDQETTPAQMHASEATLKKLGLAPPGFQLRPLIVRVLTEQVAGYYDPKSQQFHLADWIDIDGQKPIMAHELTHALQDQHFNLRRFQDWPKGDSDAELAAHSLIEGDATLAMSLYVSKSPLRALAFLKSLASTGMASEELDKAPRALRETLLFPYQEGLNWTRSLYEDGGWGKVSAAFTNLPQSTEQILHSEKYFVHEAPVKTSLPDLHLLLGRGWRRIDSDVNGEWSTYLILDQFLKSAGESRRAAAGWGGDRYAVYEDSRGQVVYVSMANWDTEKDAGEFFAAYVRRSKLRYPDARVISGAGGVWSARTSEGNVTIEMRGRRVMVIEGLPRLLPSRGILRLLWAA